MQKYVKRFWIFGLVIVLAISAATMTTTLAAKAGTVYDDMDALFRSTLGDILDYEDTDDTIVSADKQTIYDISLHELGVLYDFTYNGQSGFAVIIYDGAPTVTEVYTDASSPYNNDSYMNVYVTQGVYWYFDGSHYYDCETDLPISDESISTFEDTAYMGDVDLQYSSETVEYTYRSETKYNILSSIPTYTHASTNGCVAVAGSNIIGYYDKTYTNLIPNYEPGRTVFGKYRFNAQDGVTMAMGEQLYSDMGIVTGATVAQFKSGFQKYVNRQGYNVGYSSLMSWGSLNYNAAKTTVQNGTAIALFMKQYRATVITAGDSHDELEYEISNGNHAAAGFGCLEVNYTFANGSTRTDKYVHCSTGLGLYRNAYVNINAVQIVDALAVNIS